jgi:hypothetical protein
MSRFTASPNALRSPEAEVADPGREALDRQITPRQVDPLGDQWSRRREHLQDEIVEPRQVGLAGQAGPAERAATHRRTAAGCRRRRSRGCSWPRPPACPRRDTPCGCSCRTRRPGRPRLLNSIIAASCRTIESRASLQVGQPVGLTQRGFGRLDRVTGRDVGDRVMAGTHLGDDVRLPAKRQRGREEVGRVAVQPDAERASLPPSPSRPARCPLPASPPAHPGTSS